MWLLLIRPQRRKQQEKKDLLSNVQIGDEIVTAGGIYGTVTDVDDSDVTVEIAPGTQCAWRSAQSPGFSDDEEEEYEEDEADKEGDEPEAEGHTGHEEPAEEEEGKEPSSTAQQPSSVANLDRL